jgi:acyl-CoA synthetase (AMP-forming)/AMP-acid ligase II
MAVVEVAEELNLAAVHEAIAAEVPDRECLVWRDRRFTWAEVTERSRRFAAVLQDAGIGAARSLADCEGWESPHDHVALYLHNGNEYLEALLGAAKARAVGVNVNYRYVAEELRYVLLDSAARAIVYPARGAPVAPRATAPAPGGRRPRRAPAPGRGRI